MMQALFQEWVLLRNKRFKLTQRIHYTESEQSGKADEDTRFKQAELRVPMLFWTDGARHDHLPVIQPMTDDDDNAHHFDDTFVAL